MSDPDYQSSSDADNDHENTRPNRWTGPPTSWQHLTDAERGLAASLDTIRNGDLSIHLFNAHALKRRARELEDPEVFFIDYHYPPPVLIQIRLVANRSTTSPAYQKKTRPSDLRKAGRRGRCRQKMCPGQANRLVRRNLLRSILSRRRKTVRLVRSWKMG